MALYDLLFPIIHVHYSCLKRVAIFLKMEANFRKANEPTSGSYLKYVLAKDFVRCNNIQQYFRIDYVYLQIKNVCMQLCIFNEFE